MRPSRADQLVETGQRAVVAPELDFDVDRRELQSGDAADARHAFVEGDERGFALAEREQRVAAGEDVLGRRLRHGGDGASELARRVLGAAEREEGAAALEAQAVRVRAPRQHAIDLLQRGLGSSGSEQNLAARRVDLVLLAAARGGGIELEHGGVPFAGQLQHPGVVEAHLRVVRVLRHARGGLLLELIDLGVRPHRRRRSQCDRDRSSSSEDPPGHALPWRSAAEVCKHETPATCHAVSAMRIGPPQIDLWRKIACSSPAHRANQQPGLQG